LSSIIGQSTTADPSVSLEPLDDSGLDAEDIPAVHAESLLVSPTGHGSRLDKWLSTQLPGWSRSHLAQVIAQADVRALHAPHQSLKAAHKVKAGERYEVTLRPAQSSAAFEPQAMALEVVHEDEQLLVINKPAGLVVHPAPGHWQGTLLNGLLAHHAGAVDLPRAGIVHRLDKDTSGLMVVAKTRSAMDALVHAIAMREVGREYLALAARPWSGPRQVSVQTAMGRDPRQRLRMAVLPDGQGKFAHTDVTCLASEAQGCWVYCRLKTGRTHQIRVHLAHLRHPLLGDGLYGGPSHPLIERQALHAWRLSLRHPQTGLAMQWTQMPPPDWLAALEAWGLGYNEALCPAP
jgi:23S rRNA pseudouridine1911/1915/1917 synthase